MVHRHVSLIMVLLLAFAAVAGVAAADEHPRVTFEDQESEGDTVEVAETHYADGEYVVVIHEDDDGPGDVIGHEALDEGTHEDVEVSVDELDEGEHTLWAMLHGPNDEYGPSISHDNETVVEDAVVTVAEEEPDDTVADDTEPDDMEPDDEGLPGFTGVAAVLAVLALALLARARLVRA